MRIDDESLMAFLDGELDAVRRARVAQALETDPELRARLEAQRRLRERLAAHYGPVADEPVPERLRALLETNVVELPRSARRAPAWPWAAALAASLVLGLAIGRSLPESGPIGTEGGFTVARGELAEALDRQLASAQPADSETRIGVTFPRGDGALCRSFERAELAGLACREEGDWRIAMTVTTTGPQRSEYRQAGSGGALVMQAAQEMMAGEPLDADAERRARDSGWRASPAAD